MATAGGTRGGGPERAWCVRLPAQGEVTLDGEESLHLVRVRRVAAGDAVVLFDGQGVTRHARLLVADARAARLEVLGSAPDRQPARRLVVAASIPEPGRADELVEGLSWLGVACWVPLACARMPAGRADLPARRAQRWQRLAREAAKGNGCARLLEVAAPQRLADVLAAPPAEGALLLDPDPAAPPLLDRLPAEGPLPWLLVGPEGGFVAPELEAAGRAGVARVRLGSPALRVEQAALAAAAQALARA